MKNIDELFRTKNKPDAWKDFIFDYIYSDDEDCSPRLRAAGFWNEEIECVTALEPQGEPCTHCHFAGDIQILDWHYIDQTPDS